MQGIQVKRGDASINGEPGVIIMVSKQPGQDTVALTKTIERRWPNFAPMPPGVELDDNVFRQQHFIEASIHNVIEAIRDAAILVTVDPRPVPAQRPHDSHLPGRNPALVHHLVHRVQDRRNRHQHHDPRRAGHRHRRTRGRFDHRHRKRLPAAQGECRSSPAEDRINPLRIIYDASNEVRSTLVYATILMVIVFIPLFQLSGIEGRIFAPMGIAYIVSVLASLLVSLTVTPAWLRCCSADTSTRFGPSWKPRASSSMEAKSPTPGSSAT
jgi:hypothetical protein